MLIHIAVGKKLSIRGYVTTSLRQPAIAAGRKGKLFNVLSEYPVRLRVPDGSQIFFWNLAKTDTLHHLRPPIVETGIVMRQLVAGSHPAIPGDEASLVFDKITFPLGPGNNAWEVKFKVSGSGEV